MKFLKVSILTLLLTSGWAYAGKEMISNDKTITKIHVYDDYALIVFAPAHSNKQGCSRGYRDQVRIGTTTSGHRQMVSAALAAATAKKPVGFGIEGCVSGYVKAYRVDVGF